MTSSKNLSLEESPAFGSHGDIVDRIKKSLYYGKTRKASEVMDCPSLPLTEATVDLFERAIKNKSSVTGSICKGLEILDVNYVSDISDKACLSPCSVVVALIYMERLKKRNPEYLKTASPTDLFLISMLIASKYLFDDGEDEQVFNDEWAEFAGIELLTLNQLEIDFLLNIDWDIHVRPKQFFDKLQLIETLVTWKQTSSRYKNGGNSGYTYQELLSLEKCLSWKIITDQVLKTIALTFLTYSAVLVAVFATSIVVCSVHSVMFRQQALNQQEVLLRLSPETLLKNLNLTTACEQPHLRLNIPTDKLTLTSLSSLNSSHGKISRKPRKGRNKSFCRLQVDGNHFIRKGSLVR